MRRLASLLAVTTITLARAALACEPVPPPPEHTVDPALAAGDRTAPSTPQIALVQLSQDHGSPPGDSCGDLSSMSLELIADASDDRSPAGRIGYELLVEGRPPSGLRLPVEPFRRDAFLAGAPRFVWTFGESNEDVRFSVRVRAVDEAGNRSAASEPYLVVGHAGCSLAPVAPAAGELGGLALPWVILWLARWSKTARRDGRIVG